MPMPSYDPEDDNPFGYPPDNEATAIEMDWQELRFLSWLVERDAACSPKPLHCFLEKKMKLPECLTLDDIMEACESDENTGFCLECGSEQFGCEPDARNYVCEECSAQAVFGAQELLIMFA